jgi:hypothetical protein
MRTPFDHLLDEITEVHDIDQVGIEAWVARLERMVRSCCALMEED